MTKKTFFTGSIYGSTIHSREKERDSYYLLTAEEKFEIGNLYFEMFAIRHCTKNNIDSMKRFSPYHTKITATTDNGIEELHADKSEDSFLNPIIRFTEEDRKRIAEHFFRTNQSSKKTREMAADCVYHISDDNSIEFYFIIA